MKKFISLTLMACLLAFCSVAMAAGANYDTNRVEADG